MTKTVVTVERDVAAPPEQVWSLVSDVTRMGEWSPEALAGEWLGGASGPGVGAQFKGNNERGKRRWSTKGEVVEAEPGKAFAFDVAAGPMKVARWGFRFEPTATGCRVEERWEDHRGWLITKLGGIITGVPDRAAHNRESMTATLAALAAAAEAA